VPNSLFAPQKGFGRQMMVEQDRGVAGKVPAKLLVVDQCLVA